MWHHLRCQSAHCNYTSICVHAKMEWCGFSITRAMGWRNKEVELGLEILTKSVTNLSIQCNVGRGGLPQKGTKKVCYLRALEAKLWWAKVGEGQRKLVARRGLNEGWFIWKYRWLLYKRIGRQLVLLVEISSCGVCVLCRIISISSNCLR